MKQSGLVEGAKKMKVLSGHKPFRKQLAKECHQRNVPRQLTVNMMQRRDQIVNFNNV